MRQVLLLLHPVTPFITEELWRVLGFSGGQSIQWSNPGNGNELRNLLKDAGIQPDPSALEEMLSIRELVTSMRSLKAERNLANNNRVEFLYLADDKKSEILAKHLPSLLSSVGAAVMKRVTEPPTGMPALVTDFGSVYIDLASGIDVEAEKKRLGKELESLDKIISSIENKLKNSAFTDKAPPEVVEGARRQLGDNQSKRKETQEALRTLT